MKIIRVDRDGLQCPHFVCEQCGGMIEAKDWKRGEDDDQRNRPLVLVRRPGFVVMHNRCAPSPEPWQWLDKFWADLGFNSMGAETKP